MSKYIKIADIGAVERLLLFFFFTPILTQHPKGVDEKKKSK
jgi:hypothetical protein